MAVSVSDSSKRPAASPIKKELTPEEKIEQSRMNFLKIISATLKHQNPEKPADTSQITQTMASLHQAEETSRMRAAIDDLRKELSSNKMNKALPFQGKAVRYDTSVKKFDGENPVEFKYQLNFDEKQMPKNAVLVSNISVLDSKGIKVYQTSGKKEKGVHSLKWQGVDNNGKLNPEGEYRLKVEAFFETNEDGNIVRAPIDSGSFIDGTVESVELFGDKVKLKVNGEFIDIEDIIKIESEEKKEEVKITDYAPYIGQYAEFKDDVVEVQQGGKTKISFETDLEMPGMGSVRIFDDSDSLVGVAVFDGIKKGVNSVSITATKALSEAEAIEFKEGREEFSLLPAGKYRYELLLQNKLDADPDKFTKVNMTRKLQITGLDFSSGAYAVSGEEKFKIDSITKLAEAQASHKFYSEAINYIGKVASVNFKQFELKRGIPEKQFIKTPIATPEYSVGAVTMRVFDGSGRCVSEVRREPNSLIFSDKPFVFMMNEKDLYNYISDSDKQKLCDEFALDYVESFEEIESQYAALGRSSSDFFAELLKDYKSGEYKIDYNLLLSRNLDAEEYESAKETIEIIFDYKDLVADYEILDDKEKRIIRESIANRTTQNLFEWDGTSFEGKKLSPGKYKYEFIYEKIHNSSDASMSVIEIAKIDDLANVKISEYRMEEGEVKFYGNPIDSFGQINNDSIVGFSMDEILKLTA